MVRRRARDARHGQRRRRCATRHPRPGQLDNGWTGQADDARPAGPRELHGCPGAQRERARAGEIPAVAVTGAPRHLCAGADLSTVSRIVPRGRGRAGSPGSGTTRYACSASSACPRSPSSTGRRWAAASSSRCTAPTAPSRPNVATLGLPEALPRAGARAGAAATCCPAWSGIDEALSRWSLDRPARQQPDDRRRDGPATRPRRRGAAPGGLPGRVAVAWAADVLAGRPRSPRRPLDDAATWARRRPPPRANGSTGACTARAPAPYRAPGPARRRPRPRTGTRRSPPRTTALDRAAAVRRAARRAVRVRPHDAARPAPAGAPDAVARAVRSAASASSAPA